MSSNRSGRGGRGYGSNDAGTYLADNKTREIFASGLVEVLDYDRGSVARPVMNDRGGRSFGNNDRGGRRGAYGRR